MSNNSIQLQHNDINPISRDDISLSDPILDILNPQETDVDASCPDLNGRNEWMQYLRWVAKLHEVANVTNLSDILYVTIPFKSTVSTNNVHDYHYDVKYTKQVLNSNLLLLRLIIIQSHDNSSVNVAGSNYRVEITTENTKQVCGVKDMNDGTYLSCCQISLGSNHFTKYQISVFVQFVNFGAFEKLVSNSALIWSRELTFADEGHALNRGHFSKHNNIIHMDTKNRVCDTSKLDWIQGFWNGTSNPYPKYVVSNQHCTVPHISNNDFKECLQSKYKGGFSVIGDSHMRALYYYLVNVTTGVYAFTPTRRIDMDFNTMEFKWITTCDTLVEKLQAYVQRIADANKLDPLQQYVLFFDILAWDLMVDTYHTVSTM